LIFNEMMMGSVVFVGNDQTAGNWQDFDYTCIALYFSACGIFEECQTAGTWHRSNYIMLYISACGTYKECQTAGTWHRSNYIIMLYISACGIWKECQTAGT
jgi:ribosomal protein L32